jgi:hypothetical protein
VGAVSGGVVGVGAGGRGGGVGAGVMGAGMGVDVAGVQQQRVSGGAQTEGRVDAGGEQQHGQ